MREAAYLALSRVGKDAMHFRPASEMNEHKITCGVALPSLQHVLESIAVTLETENVQYKAIVSGQGDWRYLDLVPQAAGKRAALEYVMEVMGFEPHQTVACGDSGNDIDMMEGEHYAIVVGNAQSDLVEWAAEQEDREGGLLVKVREHRALGILEGLKILGFRD